MGQPSGTTSGTTSGTALKAPENESSASPPDELKRTGLDRCTHPKWDKQNSVPLENPVTEGDVPSGTSTEENRKTDF